MMDRRVRNFPKGGRLVVGGVIAMVAAVPPSLWMQGRAATAAVLAGHLQSNPTDIAALNHMIRLARLQRRPESAFHDLVLAAATGKVPPAQLRKLVAALIGPDRGPPILKVLTAPRAQSTAPGSRVDATWRNYLLGMAAERVRHIPAAAGFYRLSAHGDASFWPARTALVHALLAEDHFAAAQIQAQLYVQQRRFGAPAARLLVHTYAAQDRLSHALRLARALQGQYPKDYKLAMQIAALDARRGQIKHQQRELESIVHTFPNHPHACNLLIDLAGSMDNWQLAARYRHLFIQRFPHRTLAAVFVASRYARQGHLHHTEELFLANAQAHPDNAQFRQALIGIESILHQPEKAATAIAAALRKSRRQTLDATRDLCVCYLAAGRKNIAVHTAARFAHRHPQSPRWQIFYAQILLQAGQTKLAGGVLQKAALAHSRSERAAEAWADFLADGKNHVARQGAIAVINGFIRANGATTARLNFLADLEISLGDDAAMVQTYQRILAIMPANATANNDLGYYWAGKHVHLKAAREMIELALKNYPGQSAFRDSLGWVLYQQHAYHRALAQFTRAISLPGGENPVGLEHDADALYRLNHSVAAITCWQKALKLLPSVTESSAHARMVRQRIARELNRAKALQKLTRSKASQRM